MTLRLFNSLRSKFASPFVLTAVIFGVVFGLFALDTFRYHDYHMQMLFPLLVASALLTGRTGHVMSAAALASSLSLLSVTMNPRIHLTSAHPYILLLMQYAIWMPALLMWFCRRSDAKVQSTLSAAVEYGEARLKALHTLNGMSGATVKEITDFALEEAIRLTGSELGYLAFMNADETVLSMHAWSKSAMSGCEIKDKPIVYPLKNTGLWGEAVRQRRPVITNDYHADNPLKKGYPQGHVAISRHMNVPVFDGSRIVAVAGVGNKHDPYTDSDVQQLSLLMLEMWRLIERDKMILSLQHSREELEVRVAERTEELARINSILMGEISEHQSTEEKLRISEERYRMLVDQQSEGVASADEFDRFDYVNPAMENIFGVGPGELIGRSLSDFLSGEQRSLVSTQNSFRICGQTTSYELEVTRPGGEIRHVIVTGNPRLEDNRLTGTYGVFKDVTLRKAAETALRQSEELYRTLVDNLNIGVAVISPAMNILAMNRQMRQWNPAVDVTCQPVCYQAFNTPPRDGPCTYCPTIHTLQDGCLHEAITDTPAGNNSIINYRIVSSPLHDKNGGVIAAIETVEDVTERLQAEATQKQYLEDVEQILVEQTRLSAELSSSLENLEISKRQTEDALSKLQSAQASAVQSEKMASIGVLAAGIAHEINNPIGYVSSNLRQLVKYADKIRHYLTKSAALEEAVAAGRAEDILQVRHELAEMRESLRLNFIVHDLGDIARESLTGTSSVESIVKALKLYAHPDNEDPSPISVADVLENSLRIVWSQVKHRAEIIRDYDDVPMILGYIGSLQQVFSNLLVNAAQAMETHGIIQIRIKFDKPDVHVEIEDNGCGIKPEHLHHIFDPFFTTKDVGQGTGLGLSLVYDIVKKNSGDISVSSTVGKGTLFTVRFPAVVNETAGFEEDVS